LQKIRRATVQQQLVLDALKELNIHANAEQVYEYVTQIHPTISKATVYRNLGQMADDGEILNIGKISGKTHYDHNTHAHYHFICNKCNHIFDVNIDIPKICGGVLREQGFEIAGHHLSFHGLCQSCKPA